MEYYLNRSAQISFSKRPLRFSSGVVCLVVLLLLAACSKKDDNSKKAIPNFNSKLLLDGNFWMTENLNVKVDESYCYHDDTVNGDKYGRLYSWEAAREGCNSLGDGWRLPTDEEWRTMVKLYGGLFVDSEYKGESGYLNLIDGGSSGFKALLGGNRESNGEYARLGAHGFFWTATEYDSTEAWFYNFAERSALLNHHTGDKDMAASVRCIKKE